MVAAGASAASSIAGLGMRLRVRGSSVSRNPVSRKSPLSPIRQEIPSVGSAIENTTVQPPLWRENIAIGALTESFEGAMRGTEPAAARATFCGGGSAGLVVSLAASAALRRAVQEDIVDHLVE